MEMITVSKDALHAFMYVLLRDSCPVGEVRRALRQVGEPGVTVIYSDPILVQLAANVCFEFQTRLTDSEMNEKEREREIKER